MTLDPNLELVLDLEQQGEYAKALTICETLRRRAPDDAFLAHVTGVLHLSSGHPTDALAFLEQAVERDPDKAAYHDRYAAALRFLDRHAEAADHFLRAAKLDPNLRGARVHAAECLMEGGDIERAADEIEDVLANVPDNPDIRLVAARIHVAANRPDRAIAHLEEALARDPAHGLCQHMMVKTLAEKGDIDGAIVNAKRAFDDGGASGYAAMTAGAMQPAVPRSRTAMETARAAYDAAIDRLSSIDTVMSLKDIVRATPNFGAAYQGVDDSRNQRKIAAFYARVCPELGFSAPRPDFRAGEPLRIGFVSTNLYNHSVGKLYRGIITRLNRKKFDVHVFTPRTPLDEISHEIATRCDHFHVIPPEIGRARDIIAAAQPHILFYPDIGMDAFTYFLAFARLAPLQCVGWGHPVSTGIPTIDCFISSVDLESGDDANERYTEKLIRLGLPPTFLYRPAEPPVEEISALENTDAKNLYVCGQTLFKIHPDFDPLLAEILNRDTDGLAVFIEQGPGWTEALLERWAPLVPNVESRVRFLPRMSQGAFFNLLKKADAILDTPHFSGGVSSAEAFTFGKAVVTWPSDTLMPGRVTYAYYRQMGIEACCVASAEEYVETALRFGTDPAFRTKMESRIADAAAKLFQRNDVLRELEERLTGEFLARA